MKFLASLLLLLSLLLIAMDAIPQAFARLLPGAGGKAFAGGWKPVENINDAHVGDVAEFAVLKYGAQTNANLSLARVLRGETQVVAGTNYRLVLEVKDGSAEKHFEAVVWEALNGSLKLTSFKPVEE